MKFRVSKKRRRIERFGSYKIKRFYERIERDDFKREWLDDYYSDCKLPSKFRVKTYLKLTRNDNEAFL